MVNIFRHRLERILVVRPDRIGDVVLSTPVYHTLKLSFPGCFVGAFVSPYTAPLLQSNPYIDSIILDESEERRNEKDNFRKKMNEIRAHRFDTALLLLPTARLAYMIFFAGVRHRVGVGHILYEVLTFMHGVSRHGYRPLRHESDYMLDLARYIGAKDIWTTPEIFLSMEEKEAARKFLERKGFDTNEKIVALHPGSGHSSPNWDVKRYVELAGGLSEEGSQILVTGAASERNLEAAFEKSVRGVVRTSFGELTLRELISVISQMHLFISSSTGPMHIASAVGTPTLSMFCPLTACSPKLWGPLGNKSSIVLPTAGYCQVKCSGDPHKCTFGDGSEGITVQSIHDAALQMLKETEPVYPRDS